MKFRASLQSLRRSKSRGPRCQVKKHSQPPFVERLEDRTVPSILFDSFPNAKVSDGGGPLINSAHVKLIFWGKGWQQDQPSKDLQTSMVTSVTSILGSPYLNGLAQFRNGAIKSGSLTDSVSITATSPAATFSEAQAVQMLTANMKSGQNPNGALPNPKDDTQLLYVVVTQPGSTADLQYGGVHRFSQFGGSTFHYAVLADPPGNSGQSRLDFLTLVFSHELVEAVSDPELNAFQLNPRSASNELCDNAALKYAYHLDGVVVQSYWSQKDTAFIVPTETKQDFSVDKNRVLTVRGDQLADKDDVIMLDRSDAGGVIATLNNEMAQFDPCTMGTPSMPSLSS